MSLAFKVHTNSYHKYVNISNNCVEDCTVVLLCVRVCVCETAELIFECLLGCTFTTQVSYDREYGSVYSQGRFSQKLLVELTGAFEKVFSQAIKCR